MKTRRMADGGARLPVTRNDAPCGISFDVVSLLQLLLALIVIHLPRNFARLVSHCVRPAVNCFCVNIFSRFFATAISISQARPLTRPIIYGLLFAFHHCSFLRCCSTNCQVYQHALGTTPQLSLHIGSGLTTRLTTLLGPQRMWCQFAFANSCAPWSVEDVWHFGRLVDTPSLSNHGIFSYRTIQDRLVCRFLDTRFSLSVFLYLPFRFGISFL